MTTTNKLILSLGTVALLTSSALASSYEYKKGGCDYKSKKHHKMSKNGMHHKKGHHVIKTIMRLDLTPEQRANIKDILNDARKSMPNPNDAFTSTSFDKEKYAKLMKEKRDGKASKKAETIAKIYAVLNDIQRKNLKTMLDMQDMKMDKMMNYKGGSCGNKACDGRR
jgi:protein CpxP